MKQLIKSIARPVLWYVGYMAAAMIAYAALYPFLGPWTELAAELGVQLTVAFATFRYLRRKQGTGKTVLKKRTSTGIVLAFVLLGCVPTQLLVHAAGTASGFGTSNTATIIIGTLLVAPVLEEIAFRGVLFGMARRRLGFWPATVFSAVMFQLAHDMGHLPATVPLALASAALYDATGNLKYSILLHLAFNWLSAVMYDVHVPVILALPLYLAGLAAIVIGCARRKAVLGPSLVKSRG